MLQNYIFFLLYALLFDHESNKKCNFYEVNIVYIKILCNFVNEIGKMHELFALKSYKMIELSKNMLYDIFFYLVTLKKACIFATLS